MSNPTEEDWKKMTKLVDSFSQRHDAEPFREPVPWHDLGLVDYPVVIKQPMDFSTIKTKLRNKQYKTLFQVAEDVRLIWNNCMTYNADGSDFYKLADSLKRKWDERYTKLLQECSAMVNAMMSSGIAMSSSSGGGSASADAAAGVDSSGPASSAAITTTTTSTTSSGSISGAGAVSGAKASLQDRRNFARSLYSITKEDLGKVLQDVEAKCPAAIKRNAAEDELEFNIDEIPSSLMYELTQFVNSVKIKKAKKPSTNSNKKAKTTV